MAGTAFTVHSSLKARSNAQSVPNRGMSVPMMVAMLEFDGDESDTQVLDRYHTLGHEDDTTGTGIVVRSIRGVYTEVVLQAGAQAVVTLRTKGATPAALATLTFVDNEPATDTLDGSITNAWADHATSQAIATYCVPAGYGIEAALTTAGYESVAGDGTGKLLVMVEYTVIPRTITENL